MVCLKGKTVVLVTCQITQGDQNVSMHLIITAQNNLHNTGDLKMAITEYIRNVDSAILNTVFEKSSACQ
jgi:hypothetical protein